MGVMFLLRGMVFMDYMNFQSALNDYYSSFDEKAPRLDYGKMFRNIVKLRNIDFLKGFIFAPEPDDFLSKDESIFKTYKWLLGMAGAKYTDVIFGRYISRPTIEGVPKSLEDKATYYKVEKGTDINLAIHALSKAHYNSYDVAFIMSADTDYISLYKQLKTIGKIIIPVVVRSQYLRSVIPEVDDHIVLDKSFFDECLRGEKLTQKKSK